MKEDVSINIYNYNLLSTDLASPDYHIACTPNNLSTERRWSLIKERLTEQMELNSIICLQELSYTWISLLLPLFHQYGYTFIYDSQFLGVGIAFKNGRLLETDFIWVGKEIEKKCVKLDQGSLSLSSSDSSSGSPSLSTPTSMFKTISKTVGKWKDRIMSKFYSPVIDSWDEAITKKRRLLYIALELTDGEKVYVFTYHMPCKYKIPGLMHIHAAMVMQLAQEKSGSCPYVIAGDFNTTPHSSVYNMITEKADHSGKFDTSTIWSTPVMGKSLVPLKSAYMTLLGHEPLYTCYSKNKDSPTYFRDTLDYIFYSDHFTVEEVRILREDLSPSIFPDKDEPSDHLPIGCCLCLK